MSECHCINQTMKSDISMEIMLNFFFLWLINWTHGHFKRIYEDVTLKPQYMLFSF